MRTRPFWLILLATLVLTAFLALAHADTLYDYYDTGQTTAAAVYSYWWGQTFTTTAPYYLNKISILIYRVGSPGTLTVSVRATSGGLPTGSDLTTGTLSQASINSTAPGSWHNITVTGLLLSASTQYSMVIRVSSGTASDYVAWLLDSTSPSYAGGSSVYSSDGGASWTDVASYDFMFRTYGSGYSFTFAGCFDENTGLLRTASQRAVNVTAHFNDATLDEIFEVNGTYVYTTDNDLLYFSYNITSTVSESIVSQYALNLLVYNQSAYYDVSFLLVESDTSYTTSVTLSWNSTAVVSAKTTSGFRVTFGTVPNQTSNYLNYYVYRTSSSESEFSREYWVSGNEGYGGTINIFTGSNIQSYTIGFVDTAGVLKTYPHISAKRYINGTLKTVEQRKVDLNNRVLMNLEDHEKYTLTIENSGTVYTFGDLQMTSSTTIDLTITGLDFPSNIVLAYTKVRMYATRYPSTQLNFYYQDLTNSTAVSTVYIYYADGSLAYNTTLTDDDSFVVSWASAEANHTYSGKILATHEKYGTLAYNVVFPRAYDTPNPWGMDWLGDLPGSISTEVLVGTFIVLCAFGVWSQLNIEAGAFFGIALTALLVWIGWLPIPVGMVVLAFGLMILWGLGRKRRRTFEL